MQVTSGANFGSNYEYNFRNAYWQRTKDLRKGIDPINKAFKPSDPCLDYQNEKRCYLPFLWEIIYALRVHGRILRLRVAQATSQAESSSQSSCRL